MVVGQEGALVPLFDTTRIHAEEAVEMALDGRELAGLLEGMAASASSQ